MKKFALTFFLFGLSVCLASTFASSMHEDDSINKNIDQGQLFQLQTTTTVSASAPVVPRLLSLPDDLFVKIMTYLDDPHSLLCVLYRGGLKYDLKSDLTFRFFIADRFKFLLSSKLDISELVWFTQPPPYNPGDSLVSGHFVKSVTTALLLNETFPNYGSEMTEQIIKYITSPGFLEMFPDFFAKNCDLVGLLAAYTFKKKRFPLTARVFDAYPLLIKSFKNSTVEDLLILQGELGTERYFSLVEKSIIYALSPDGSHFFNLLSHVLADSLLILSPDLILNIFKNDKFCFPPKNLLIILCELDLKYELFAQNDAILEKLEVVFKDDEYFVEDLEILNRIWLNSEIYLPEAETFDEFTDDYLHLFAIVAIKAKNEKYLEKLLDCIVSSNVSVRESLIRALCTFPEYLTLLTKILSKHNKIPDKLKSTFFRTYSKVFTNAAYFETIVIEIMHHKSIEDFFKNDDSIDVYAKLDIFSKFYKTPAILQILLSARDFASSTSLELASVLGFHIDSPSDADNFTECLKIIIEANASKPKDSKSSSKPLEEFIASHEIILIILNNQDLHKVFGIITIRMSSSSVLTVIRTPSLLANFSELFSTFGRKIEFNTADVLNLLTRNSEFEALKTLTGKEIGDILISNLRNLDYYKNRSAFLYWLRSGLQPDQLWTKVSVEHLKLLYLDSPEKLKQSFYKLEQPAQPTVKKPSSKSVAAKFKDVFGVKPLFKGPSPHRRDRIKKN